MKKQIFIIASSILVISTISCNSQSKSDSIKQANDIQDMVKENSPGYTPTSADYYMKAKINGKDWVADEFLVNDGGGIVGQTKKGESITLPFQLRYAREGEKTNFKNHAVNIYMKDGVGIWGGTQGEMIFTKVGDNYAEGKFYVTAAANDTDKQLTITDGVFRILLAGQ